MLTKQQITAALYRWINQRPGLDFANYGDVRPYRAELRQIAKDKRDAMQLLRVVELRDSITAEMILDACKHAYSGRLSIYERDGKAEIDYCTGQYWPTEYRKAAAAVLSSALWHWTREHCMPSKIVEGDQSYYPHANGSKNKQSAGDWLRTHFRREFGRTIQQRWFS